MVHVRRRRPSRFVSATNTSSYIPPSSSSSSTYSLPSINCDTAAIAAGKFQHLNFSLIDDIDALCKRDPEFLAVLPAAVKRRILRMWAEDVKDYRFYGEGMDEESRDFDTEVS